MKIKAVLKLDLRDDRSMREAIKIADKTVPGMNSIMMDMEFKEMTVVGDGFDACILARGLRKHWATELVSVLPFRNQEDNNYDGEGGGGGGGGGGNGGDHQDPFNLSRGQNGSHFYTLKDYDNWYRNERRIQILMFFFFVVRRFVLLLRGSTKVFTI